MINIFNLMKRPSADVAERSQATLAVQAEQAKQSTYKEEKDGQIRMRNLWVCV